MLVPRLVRHIVIAGRTENKANVQLFLQNHVCYNKYTNSYSYTMSAVQEYNKDAWVEIVQRCEEAGVDAFEVNFSCPHGMPERKMGMAMGQCPDLLEVPRCAPATCLVLG